MSLSGGPSGTGFTISGPSPAGTIVSTITPNGASVSVLYSVTYFVVSSPKSSVPNVPTSLVGTVFSPSDGLFVGCPPFRSLLYS